MNKDKLSENIDECIKNFKSNNIEESKRKAFEVYKIINNFEGIMFASYRNIEKYDDIDDLFYVSSIIEYAHGFETHYIDISVGKYKLDSYEEKPSFNIITYKEYIPNLLRIKNV